MEANHKGSAEPVANSAILNEPDSCFLYAQSKDYAQRNLIHCSDLSSIPDAKYTPPCSPLLECSTYNRISSTIGEIVTS